MSIKHTRARTRGLLATSTAILVVTAVPPCAAVTSYYVATDGNDQNDGRTLKTPFRTVQRAADAMQPGDACLIRSGEYREKIVPPRGGTSVQARITYRNYPGEAPVIKGSERVTGWVDQGGGLWRAQLPRAFFVSSPYNPFATKVAGSCIVNPDNNWSLGMVYLNGRPLGERLSEAEVRSAPMTWWATVDKGVTSVCARFDTDPNKALVEVNVRDSCFHPGTRVLSFISIVGLAMRQAAPNGSGNTHPQQGIITAYAGKGWVIEDCTISDSACSGIALATGPEAWYSPRSATQDPQGAVPDFHASGHHLVRRNTIQRCGQAGIIGMINGHSSVIEANLIEDTNWERKIGGAETAGIKLHWAIDAVIRNNIIRRVANARVAGQSFGLWLDFGNQGTRVSGNVIYDINDPERSTPKSFPLYLEANVGPVVVDNNILIHDARGPYNNEIGSLHAVVAHNLVVEGRFQHFNDPSRNVPYYRPNSLKYVGRLDAESARRQDLWRYINRNNIYVGQWSGQEGATVTAGNVSFGLAELQALKLKRTDAPTGVAIDFDLSAEAVQRLRTGDMVTSEDLGEFPLVKQRMADSDGKLYDIDTDIAGRPRTRRPGSAVAGPFAALRRGRNAIFFSAGCSVRQFCRETIPHPP